MALLEGDRFEGRFRYGGSPSGNCRSHAGTRVLATRRWREAIAAATPAFHADDLEDVLRLLRKKANAVAGHPNDGVYSARTHSGSGC
jgi:hypothetical protein